ncbi:Protein of unknown function [Pseudobutyrivibrio sp. NOR37]|uniref:DUF2974 domain-containing protein n=1 Tax=Pseudobutyrivibrio xylanivorans TaxID=185007 RepID=A0A6M0LNG8_PSEXY|nr:MULTISPECIES: Mbeg1-like protein [Pseudobutyrivibrio]NEX02371.1 DUF2974 domain-containing protein [Pseudobutyrivibrio xylanivorans]SFR78603.1 Protein of unknown function [Pseudobutyrivibrio sp. NOR37]
MANDNYSEGKYSDEQIALLEQITYISNEVLAAAHIPDEGETPLCLPMKEGVKVKDLLKDFTPEKIENLRECGDDIISSSRISGAEWASIIKAIKDDPELMSLEVVKCQKSDDGGANLNVCYKDNETGEGIITYKGTTGHDEWYDDCMGMVETDTDDQNAAYEFYEEVEDQFSEITVAGHSKGANKAMYVMIRADDDKIKRCVAFDGQGFSNEFLEHYAGEIKRHGRRIINYALSVDFVHALLKQIPNAEMEFVQGYCLGDGGQYHSPNSFFIMDDNGNIQMQNGEPQFDIVPEDDDNIKHINGFTTYIMDNYPKEDLEEMADYMGNFVALSLGDEDAKGAFKYLLSEPEKLKKIKEMILEYGKENNLTEQDFNSFIGTFFPNEEDAQLAERICHALNEDGICDALIDYSENHDNGLVGFASQIQDIEYLLDQGAAGTGAFLGGEVEQQFQQWGSEIDAASASVGGNVGTIGEGLGNAVEFVGDIAGQGIEAAGEYGPELFTFLSMQAIPVHQPDFENYFSGFSIHDGVSNFVDNMQNMIVEIGDNYHFTIPELIQQVNTGENKQFNETYTPIENIDEYMNSVRKSIIKPSENQPQPVARKAFAHC